MIFKNSFKIAFGNYTHVKKILLSLIFNLLVFFVLAYVFAGPVVRVLQQNAFGQIVNGHYTTYFGQPGIANVIGFAESVVKDFFAILSHNFYSIQLPIVFFLANLFVLLPFLNTLIFMPVTNLLYQFMSNNVKMHYVASGFLTFKKNLAYSFWHVVLVIPFCTLNIFGAYYIIAFLLSLGANQFVALFVAVFVYMIANAFKNSLVKGWLPALTVLNIGVFKAFAKSIKINFKQFVNLFANNFYMSLTLFVINVSFAICTFGVGLLVSLPFSILVINCFNMVVFYKNYGMRFYADEHNIIVPKKLKETDNDKRVKYIV